AQLLGGETDVFVPLGFQYDVPSPTLKGLYAYPRFSAGYAYSTREGARHAAVAIPELGVKYVFGGRFNLGLEPFSLPIAFGAGATRVHYRAHLVLGFNF
ncbi:MAG TPA: hypothetical protein VFY71_14670, partial [Planctomycetota bacterium]|nr:hypothetical protein [Planctomycetota bacterium]